jgi:hypothetical protein
MRTPVDFNLAVVQQVTPFAQRIRRRLQSGGIFTNAPSAPVHRLHMHGPERLLAAIAYVRAHAKTPSSTSRQCFLPLFTALCAAQFRLIFRALARSFLASKVFCQRLNVVSPRRCWRQYFRIPSPLRRHASHSRLALFEMFRTHRRISTASESPKWNANHLRKVVQGSDG